MNEHDSSLAPQQIETEDSQEWAIEPTGQIGFAFFMPLTGFEVQTANPINKIEFLRWPMFRHLAYVQSQDGEGTYNPP